MNLKDKYTEMFSNQDSWKYYSSMQVEPFDFGDDCSCKEFIYKYFDSGSKKDVFTHLKDLNCEIKDTRFLHMVSTYFLGILLSEVFFTEQEKKYNQTNDFRWIWFILCLYHDIGYIFEQNQNMFENILSYNNFIYNESLDLKYIFQKKLKYPLYSQALVANYFDYRIKEYKILEHGTIGGTLLYDKLCKNYYSAKKSSGSTNVDFVFNGLSWKYAHLETFAHLADIISAHNIWRIKSSDTNVEIYKKYNLYELIDTKFDQPKTFHTKLFYLLCICDTIEPTKIFNQVNPIYVLEKINISISDKIITISVLDDNFNNSELFKKVFRLQNWLNLKSERADRNAVTLTITV